MLQYWVAPLNAGVPWQTNVGTTLNTATTATLSFQAPTNKDFTLPAGWFQTGMAVRVTARGVLASGGTTSNLTWIVAATGSNTALATSTALTLGTGSLTNVPWALGALIRCIAVGSTGSTLETSGEVIFGNVAGATSPTLGTAAAGMVPLPDSSVAIDTTAAVSLQLRGTLSAAFGSCTCQNFLLESVA
jgi:hypothetical protein